MALRMRTSWVERGAALPQNGLDLVTLELRGVTVPINALAVPRQMVLETALAPVVSEAAPEA